MAALNEEAVMTEWNATKAQAAARLLELIAMRLISESIHVTAALGVADLLGDAPKSAEQLAEETGVNAASLRRVLRALVTFNVFSEDSKGRFALAPMGECLKREAEGSLHSAAMFFGGERGARVDELFLHCVKTGETVGRKLSGGNWISWLQSDPELTRSFNAMMTAFSTLHLTGVLEAYDFSRAATIVDVGGGHGKIISEILKRNPEMRGVLFDLPHAFEGGRKTIAQAGLADRCEVVSGDFFVSVPAGADAYVLSRVIHDWDDEKAIAVLKVVRQAIVPGGRLILLEAMLRPDQPTVYPVLSDLNMLIRTGGCERTEAEYLALYRSAGFELTRTVATISPTGTTVIEGRPLSGR
jgi:O-methyltransferase domain